MTKRKESNDVYEQYFAAYFDVDYDIWYPYAKGYFTTRFSLSKQLDVINKEDEMDETRSIDAILYYHKNTSRLLLIVKLAQEGDDLPIFWLITRPVEKDCEADAKNDLIVCIHEKTRQYNTQMAEHLDNIHTTYNIPESVITEDRMEYFLCLFVRDCNEMSFEPIEDYDDDHREEEEKECYENAQEERYCKRFAK